MADDGLAPMKTCTKCGVEKCATAEFFGKSKLGKFGLKSRCRPCKVESEREYNRAYLRVYYQEHRADMIVQKKEAYRSADKELLNLKSRARYAKNKHLILAKGRAWRGANPDRARDIVKRYEARNPDIRRVVKANRRAREISAAGSVALTDVVAIREAQGGMCRWCQEPLTRFHLDHVVPLSRGGTSEPGNLVLACPSCNLRKANKLIEELGWS